MKLRKKTSRGRPGTILCGLLLTAVLFAGCDTFESDVTEPAIQVSGEELYVLAEGETVIDLNALVSANFAGRLTVTELPTQGTLQNIAEGLLRYAPKKGLARTRDRFELTVFAADNRILKKDTIHINIETDSTKLPCNIYPIADHVTGFGNSVAVMVNVLKNDILCGKTVIAEVYAPHVMPRHGSAEMSGATMVYTPGASFTGIDTIIYKVINVQNPSSSGYGFVYINRDSLRAVIPESPCIFQAVQDSVDITALSTSLIYLDVLKNDQLCDSLKILTITRHPRHGTAFIDNSTKRIGYNRVVLESDSLQYEICNGRFCRRATAYIKQG
ncbi:MAG TPA: Ig-like domain-containing protein [Chryseolinea sp.]|nr:Ig-like domain-containing protein [Chryseolinea sp.]